MIKIKRDIQVIAMASSGAPGYRYMTCSYVKFHKVLYTYLSHPYMYGVYTDSMIDFFTSGKSCYVDI